MVSFFSLCHTCKRAKTFKREPRDSMLHACSSAGTQASVTEQYTAYHPADRRHTVENSGTLSYLSLYKCMST
jgi:hypothetical protein